MAQMEIDQARFARLIGQAMRDALDGVAKALSRLSCRTRPAGRSCR